MTDKVKLTKQEFEDIYEIIPEVITKETIKEEIKEELLTEAEQLYEDKYYENMNIDEEKENGN